MNNQRVVEYTIETGPNGLPVARLGIVHKLMSFSEGQWRFHYYDGKWVNDGGVEIDETTIPEHCKEQVRTHQWSKQDGGPDTLVTCEFCTYMGPSRDYAKHLASAHIKQIDNVPPPVVRLRPEDLPPDSYETDELGFVVMNAEGRPMKKAGRKKE